MYEKSLKFNCQEDNSLNEKLHSKSDNKINDKSDKKVDKKTSQFFKDYKRIDFIFVYFIVIFSAAIFLLVYISGIYSNWYATLKQTDLNPWIPRISWVIASAISYIGLYILWNNVKPEQISKFLGISVLFFIATFILTAWAAALYHFENIGMATWISGALFIYEFWLFIYIWNIKPVAALLQLPLVIMYLYLFYSMIHLAFINDIGL